jgi:predicted RNase H-like HicB family nuclease
VLSEYLAAALGKARYEILPDDGSYYGEIPSFDGVYANAKTLEACREELREVLEEWVLFRVSRNLPLPTVDGRELAIRATAQSGCPPSDRFEEPTWSAPFEFWASTGRTRAASTRS